VYLLLFLYRLPVYILLVHESCHLHGKPARKGESQTTQGVQKSTFQNCKTVPFQSESQPPLAANAVAEATVFGPS
jgi:hypothetical protein